MAPRSSEMSGIFDWLKPKPKAPSTPPPQINVDLYAVLGVSPNASQEDIKKAFRELAMKFHPDRNPDDAVAEKKYSEISTAYAILGDETQRAAYDRLRPPPPPPETPRYRSGLIPRGAQPSEGMVAEPEKPKSVSKAIDKNVIEKMFGIPKKKKGEEKELTFDFLSPGLPKQPPARIPNPTSAFASFDPASRRIPMMPAIDVPDDNELMRIVEDWHLDKWAWDIAREARFNPEFQRVGSMALDVLAGAWDRPAEVDLADRFHLSRYQVEQVLNMKDGREAYYMNVIYPIFDRVIAILDQIKPPDLPGRFFLDWDPSGKMIEFFYAENIGRRH